MLLVSLEDQPVDFNQYGFLFWRQFRLFISPAYWTFCILMFTIIDIPIHCQILHDRCILIVLPLTFESPKVWTVLSLSFYYYFSRQIAFISVVYPALVLAYMGQAAFISQHHNFESSYQIGFYVSVPGNSLIYLFSFKTLFSKVICYHITPFKRPCIFWNTDVGNCLCRIT